MKHLKRYNIFEGRESKSYTKEDHHKLDELSQDIRNIMLDIIDEYQLTDVEPSNAENLDTTDDDIDYELGETPNSYFITNDVIYSRHGAYGMVTIKINCKKLYDEVAPSMGKEEGLFKDFISRLDTIGNAYVEYEENGLITGDGDLLRIEVTPRD